MTEEEQKAIKKLEIEGTENNYLEVKIVLDLVDKQQETLRKQSYTNKKLRNKIKTVRKERNKLQKDIEIKDKVIDEILSYMLNEVICEPDLDYIYGKMNNCCGAERNWTRGDKEELKMLKQYFYKKVEEENENN